MVGGVSSPKYITFRVLNHDINNSTRSTALLASTFSELQNSTQGVSAIQKIPSEMDLAPRCKLLTLLKLFKLLTLFTLVILVTLFTLLALFTLLTLLTMFALLTLLPRPTLLIYC